MIKTVVFNKNRVLGGEDCLVIKSVDCGDQRIIMLTFPFSDFTPIDLTVPEALTIRNAIDELCAVKMIGEPEVIRTDGIVTRISFPDRQQLLSLLNKYQNDNNFDLGARSALSKVYKILNLVRGGNHSNV